MQTNQVQIGEEGDASWQPSPAIMKLLADHNNSTPSLGAERAIHYTAFYKKAYTRRLPSLALFKAEAFADHLQRRSIQVHEGELFVGSHTEHRIGAICHVELAGVAMLEDLFKFEKRTTNPLYVGKLARRQLALKVIPYWMTRNLVMRAFPFTKIITYLREQLKVKQFVINEAGGVAHFVPNFELLIGLGSEGLRNKIKQQLQQADLTDENVAQLKANLVALSALESFADRYRELAKQQGRDDLVKLLNNSPRKPAISLYEALQTIWFFQMLIQIESLDQGISLGRIDQYLYPLYRQELAEGRFDEARFKNQFCALCIKLSEVIPLFSERATQMFSGWPSGQALTLGGLDENGHDASNELTMMLLDVADKFKTRQPNWHARLSETSSPAYTRHVFDVIARGGGSPALYNDDVILPAMEQRQASDVGKNLVWNYATVGCVEPAVPGISYTSSDAAIFNLALILENILLGHNSPGAAKFSPRPSVDLSKIDSMEDLWQAIEQELRYQIGYLKDCLDRIESANRDHHPVPFSSLTVTGCIESATDLTAGGAWINASGIQGVGVADLANSMAAIETLVFDQQQLTLTDLAKACLGNFSGQEALQARLLKVEKFGNDQRRVDGYAARITELFDVLISQYRNTRGGKWMPGFYSMTCHRAMGANMAALPSGRLQGQALADGIAPTDGSDCLGPTASLNSIAKLDHKKFGNGINLNIKFDANTLKGETGTQLLKALVKGYFQQGGMQVQVNVLDPQVLLDAKQNPQLHRNLLVRISGYSAYFVDLTPAMQDEIIERTLQRVG